MDDDEVRRKRIKLFDPSRSEGEMGSFSSRYSNGHKGLNMGQRSAPQTAATSFPDHYPQSGHSPFQPLVGHSLDPHHGPAYQYQNQQTLQPPMGYAQTPQAVGSRDTGRAAVDLSKMMSDEQQKKLGMCGQLDKGKDYHGGSLGAQWSQFPDHGVTMTEDEKVARELQAQFDNTYADYYTPPPPLPPLPPPTPTPSLLVKLPLPPPTKQLVMARNLDDSGDAIAVRELAATITNAECGVCGHGLHLDQNKLVALFNTAVTQPNNGSIDFLLKCPACSMKHCSGCHEAVTASGVEYGNVASNKVHLTWHCDRGRLALIWFLLCGFDNAATHNKISAPSKPRSPPALAPLPKGASELTKLFQSGRKVGSGTGYSTNRDDYSYSYDDDEDATGPFSGGKSSSILSSDPLGSWNPMKKKKRRQIAKKTPALDVVDPDDNITTYVMTLLTAALPSPNNHLIPTKFDHQPPECLKSILTRSSILDKAAELLRNDSLDNAMQRLSLYESLLKFIQALENGGTDTASIIYNDRRTNKAGHNLLKVSLGSPTRVENEELEFAASLALAMENLIQQSTSMIRAMEQNGFDGDETQMLCLCTLILDATSFINDSDHRKNKQSKHKDERGPAQKLKELVILAVEDEKLLQDHNNNKDARALEGTLIAPRGRLAHIYKEIVSLETRMPEGIFVRYGETRPDVMKVVIIGPRGSPYQHGMFEFDLFCPLKYPESPPEMLLKTTGGGRVGFNPNLYANGKVCLSLLGTWPAGEPWDPKNSTLLQLLVSIQAMIFNDEPWCNEPERDGEGGSEKSKKYNRGLYPNVVEYGMIEWLEGKRTQAPVGGYGQGRRLGQVDDDAGKSEDIWAEVTKLHFEDKGEEIMKTVCEWINDAPAEPKPNPRALAKKSINAANFLPFNPAYGPLSSHPPSWGLGPGPTSGMPSHMGNPFAGPGQALGTGELAWAAAVDPQGVSSPRGAGDGRAEPAQPAQFKQGSLASKLRAALPLLKKNEAW